MAAAPGSIPARALRQPCNPRSAALALRALFLTLEEWVTKDVEPPPSLVPRIADGTAVAAENIRMPAVPGFAHAPGANPIVPPVDRVDPPARIDNVYGAPTVRGRRRQRRDCRQPAADRHTARHSHRVDRLTCAAQRTRRPCRSLPSPAPRPSTRRRTAQALARREPLQPRGLCRKGRGHSTAATAAGAGQQSRRDRQALREPNGGRCHDGRRSRPRRWWPAPPRPNASRSIATGVLSPPSSRITASATLPIRQAERNRHMGFRAVRLRRPACQGQEGEQHGGADAPRQIRPSPRGRTR
jgi:hypothetical protein